MIQPDGRVVVDTLDFDCEDSVWRICLGWPDAVEIRMAKSQGYRVFRARVDVHELK